MSEESIGLYAVYGHVLAGTALLVILRDVLALRSAGREPTRRNRVLWYAMALVAATSFGNGTAIAIVLPFALHLLLPPDRSGARRWPPLLSLVIVIPLVYLTTITAWESLSDAGIYSPDMYRSLTTTPVLHVEFAVLLIAVGFTRLLLGFSLPHENPALLALAVLGVLVTASLRLCARGSRPDRRLVAALALLLLTNYGVISLARGIFAAQAMEKVVSWGRYHYVGQILFALLLCFLAVKLAGPVRRGVAVALLAAWYGFALACYVLWAAPIDNHDSARRDTEEVLREIRAAIDRRQPGETVVIANRPFAPLVLPGFPGWIAAFVSFFPENTVGGREVRFLVRDPNVRRVLASGERTATLVVAPEDLRPGGRAPQGQAPSGRD